METSHTVLKRQMVHALSLLPIPRESSTSKVSLLESQGLNRLLQLAGTYVNSAHQMVYLREDGAGDLAAKGNLAVSQVLPEYSSVRLIDAYSVDGLELPRGAEGTIVDILANYDSYTVEFHSPKWCVETIAMNLVEPI